MIFLEQSSELVNNLGEARFDYCYKSVTSESDYNWKDVWLDGTKIPRGVRIKMGTFEKTIFIPIGELGGEG